MKIVMDSDVLIKLTKTGSKEIIVGLLEVFIPERVHEETVIESEDCADARTIQKNINEGKIYVSGSSGHDKGEIETLRLYLSGGFELIVSDDRKFLNHLARINIPYLTSSSLIVYLLYKKRLTKKDTTKYIDSLKVHISRDQYRTAMSEVLRWEK
jgi:predicted nucleic acid-binding protein